MQQWVVAKNIDSSKNLCVFLHKKSLEPWFDWIMQTLELAINIMQTIPTFTLLLH